jgi:hypothetical protein
VANALFGFARKADFMIFLGKADFFTFVGRADWASAIGGTKLFAILSYW